MKTTKQILLIVTGLILLLFVIGLIMLRHDLKNLALENAPNKDLRSIDLDSFDTIEISADWEIQIRQGRIHLLEIASDSTFGYHMIVKDHTLWLSADTASAGSGSKSFARITVPSLRYIHVEGKADLELKRYVADTMKIVLEGGGVVNGTENKIEYYDVQTMEQARVILTDDPYD